ncbi:hypothetical protein OOZ54_23645 [Rhodopseudomonas palustris]|uniref:hypothetical protein n=1 Tax=Rhodopseudomonas palustris TaxID=1076 RepID=UPI0022F0A221|nr:hypothetical protein [Rhodopseudomonas palustris]WBU29616.1 hypothetical protein OOZ54_23645 [Rhodopseudomonas palustris]
MFSEPGIIHQSPTDMNLKIVLAKKPSELSEAEKAYLKQHSEELTAAQKKTFAEAIGEEQVEEEPEAPVEDSPRISRKTNRLTHPRPSPSPQPNSRRSASPLRREHPLSRSLKRRSVPRS